MSNEKKIQDEPAFPVADYHSNIGDAYPSKMHGLSKREYFAAMAMQGTLAADATNQYNAETIAKWSVECADALLAALRG